MSRKSIKIDINKLSPEDREILLDFRNALEECKEQRTCTPSDLEKQLACKDTHELFRQYNV